MTYRAWELLEIKNKSSSEVKYVGDLPFQKMIGINLFYDSEHSFLIEKRKVKERPFPMQISNENCVFRIDWNLHSWFIELKIHTLEN